MKTKYYKAIGFAVALGILIWVIWYATSVFLLAFAAILLAILLNAIGRGARKITHLPYPAALLVALIVILGIFTLTFWLYSPLIAVQFGLLMDELPQAVATLHKNLTPYLSTDFLLKMQKEFSLSNQKLLTQLLSVFSTTLGSIAGFIIFLIVGLYLAFDPPRYVKWILLMIPTKKIERVAEIMNQMGQSLRWWLLGKVFSMAFVGIFTIIGLSLLHVSLAFILGLLAALLTFIPYVGAILASIPAILIGFTHSPWQAIYVIILYLIIHIIDGYLMTPFIEQRTVSIPPAVTILAQVLMVILIGGFGLALATPLLVVGVALVHNTLHRKSMKVVKES